VGRTFRDGKFVVSHFGRATARPRARLPDGGLAILRNRQEKPIAVRQKDAKLKDVPEPTDRRATQA
jgi:hypothetical protein